MLTENGKKNQCKVQHDDHYPVHIFGLGPGHIYIYHIILILTKEVVYSVHMILRIYPEHFVGSVLYLEPLLFNLCV